MTQVDPHLEAHNARGYRGVDAPASTIDIPVTPVTADVAMQAILRVEAKVDAIGKQLNWMNDTVLEFVNGIKNSPMSGMLMKKMGQ